MLILIYKNKEGHSALILACAFSNTTSNTETVRLLLEAGADINLKDNNSFTAIMGHLQTVQIKNVIKILFDYNPDLNLNVVASNGTTVYDQLTNKPELNEFFHKCFT